MPARALGWKTITSGAQARAAVQASSSTDRTVGARRRQAERAASGERSAAWPSGVARSAGKSTRKGAKPSPCAAARRSNPAPVASVAA
jgi:hypothetical protein